MNNLDEAVQLFLLSDKDLRIKAEIQALKLLQDDKYNSYDKEFKDNFIKSFCTTFISEIENNRENMAYTLLQNKYSKDIILKAGRITPTKLKEMDVLENSADILMKFMENNN